MKVYRKIFALLTRAEKWRFAQLGFVAIALGLFEAVGVVSILPFLAVLANPAVIHDNPTLAWVYARSGAQTDQAFLAMIGALVFCVLVLSQAIKAAGFYALTRFARMRDYSISTRLMARYLAQPYAWFLGRNTVNLRKTLLQEVNQAVSNVVLPAVEAVAQGVVILFLVALMVAVDPPVALATAVMIGGAYGLLTAATRGRISQAGRERALATTRRFRIAADTMGGIKEIKLAGLERTFNERYRIEAARLASALSRQKMLSELPRYGLEAVLYGGMILLVLFLLARSEDGVRGIIPTLGLYAVAMARVFPAAQGLYRKINLVKFGAAALDSVVAEFERTADLPAPTIERGEPIRLRERLELRDVIYAYPGAPGPALRGLEMTIEANRTVGVVGGTGAGKTTTVDVILGLLTPDAGGLYVDGVRIGPESMRRWQRSLGYVPQQIFLVDETVSGNIAFGVPPERIDAAAVERAARAAQIHDFVVQELPEGYATRIGERGKRLSGGQRQRIGIARALYHDPDVLIFDEATSALDNLTERDVMEAVDALRNHKTIIMIAHRLSTVRNCDRIFFLEQGKVRRVGGYDELVEGDEAFRRLAFAQG